MSLKRVIVITGTPGVGKTTVSRALAKRLKTDYLNIGAFVKSEQLFLGFDEERKTFIADLDALSKKVTRTIIDTPRDIVIEGHYASDVVPPELVTHVFVFRRDPEELRMKLKERGYEERKILENLASEVLDVCLTAALRKYGARLVDEIDLTSMNVNETIEETLKVINGARKAGTGKVDWLGRLAQEGRLTELLNQLNKI